MMNSCSSYPAGRSTTRREDQGPCDLQKQRFKAVPRYRRLLFCTIEVQYNVSCWEAYDSVVYKPLGREPSTCNAALKSPWQHLWKTTRRGRRRGEGKAAPPLLAQLRVH